jgi:cell division protein ZapA
MPHVSVTIGGRAYRLSCNEGEEPHLVALAGQVDSKITEMRGAFGEIGDQRLVVMAALTIADQLSEARRAIATLEARVAESAQADAIVKRDAELQATACALALNEASHRIEGLALALSEPAKEETA